MERALQKSHPMPLIAEAEMKVSASNTRQTDSLYVHPKLLYLYHHYQCLDTETWCSYNCYSKFSIEKSL